MAEFLSDLKRTHTCGQLRASHVGDQVVLMGWVDGTRDFGRFRFVILRDRFGTTQVRFDEHTDARLFAASGELRPEWVVAVLGRVVSRGDQANADMATGDIEVEVQRLEVLNSSVVPRFPVRDEVDANEELRLEYRFLDLRRKPIQDKIVLRAEVTHIVRDYLHGEGFLDLETPVLTKSTPEGARDYLVPSRVHPGEFYALPQSPQLFKQLYMISGYDRYFQICRCFRDEDLRADRQPEFTQIDIEMSFIDRDDIYDLCDRMMARIWKDVHGVELELPLPRMTYHEAMQRFGVDNPDMRYGLELVDLSTWAVDCGFVVMAEASDPQRQRVATPGTVRGIRVPGGASRLSRKQLDSLSGVAQRYGGKFVMWAKVGAELEWSGGISGKLLSDKKRRASELMDLEEGDLALFVADERPAIAGAALGNVRKHVASELDLIPADAWEFTWVTDFPLLEYDEVEGRYFAMHHPFTSPRVEDLALLDSDPGAVKARAYDLVLNGNELGGGSIRIHDQSVQSKMFDALGIGEEEAEQKFGFLLKALRHGAPPHGGIAFGLDRLIMLLSGAESLRDVIAYPKTASATCLLTDAPSPVDDRQLAELHIARVKAEE